MNKAEVGLVWRISLILVVIILWQQADLYKLQQEQKGVQDSIKALKEQIESRYEQLSEYYFLADLTLPDSVYFADSLLILDKVSKARLSERIIYLSRRELLLVLSKRMQEWQPILEPILLQEGFHLDFFYMAIAESFLNPAVISSAQAKGIWQFGYATARRFGLKIDWWVDERFDPVLSTRAAVRYLRYLGKRYNNNWPLVAAAYNMGENGLDRYIRKNGHDKYFGMRLPAETSLYFFNILAIKFIVENTDWLEYFSSPRSYTAFSSCYEIQVIMSKHTPLREVIAGFGNNYYLFRLLNGKYRRDFFPAGKNIIRVPHYLLDDFISFLKDRGWQYSFLPS